MLVCCTRDGYVALPMSCLSIVRLLRSCAMLPEYHVPYAIDLEPETNRFHMKIMTSEVSATATSISTSVNARRAPRIGLKSGSDIIHLNIAHLLARAPLHYSGAPCSR